MRALLAGMITVGAVALIGTWSLFGAITWIRRRRLRRVGLYLDTEQLLRMFKDVRS